MFLLLFTIATANILCIPYFCVEYLEYFIINGLVPLINHIYNIKDVKRIIEIRVFTGTTTKPLEIDNDIKERLDKVIISLNNLHSKFDSNETDSLPDLISINSNETDSLPDLISINSDETDSLPNLISINSNETDSLPDLISINSDETDSLPDLIPIIKKKSTLLDYKLKSKIHRIYTTDVLDDVSESLVELDEETDEESDKESTNILHDDIIVIENVD